MKDMEIQPQDLEYMPEYSVTQKPFVLDLVIRKKPGVVLQNEIGAIFKGHNIFEYKAPGESLDIDTFYKVIAYACLYAAEKEVDETGKTIHRSAEDITITLVQNEKPVVLFKELSEMGYSVSEYAPGIYWINGNPMGFCIQIIVSDELTPGKHKWLSSLRNDISYDHLDRLYEALQSAKGSDSYADMKDMLLFLLEANPETGECWKKDRGITDLFSQ